MSLRAVRVAALAAFVFVLQQSLVTKLRIFGVHPDLLLLLALSVGVTGGRNRGAVAGFAAGVAVDVFLTSPLGLSALAYTVAAYVVGAFGEGSSKLAWVISMIVGGGTALAVGLFMVFGAVLGDIHITWRHAGAIALVEIIGNAVLAPMVALLLRDAWQEREVAW